MADLFKDPAVFKKNCIKILLRISAKSKLWRDIWIPSSEVECNRALSIRVGTPGAKLPQEPLGSPPIHEIRRGLQQLSASHTLPFLSLLTKVTTSALNLMPTLCTNGGIILQRLWWLFTSSDVLGVEGPKQDGNQHNTDLIPNWKSLWV